MLSNNKDKKTKNENIDLYKNVKPFIKKDEYSKFKSIIEVKNLAHVFNTRKSKKEIYSGISFEIYENERVAFLGPNGAGKTLTISTICGIYKPKIGDISYNFKYTHSPYEKLSVQFQDLQFPSSLTGRDLINFSLKLSNIQINEKDFKEGIKILNLEDILNIKMSKLSGGQQQRINVFMAMLGRPKVLFLDEFTTGLDIAIKNKIQKYIKDYCDKYKISLVIISHDIDTIEELADRVIILADKRIILDAQKKDIINKFGSYKNMLKKYILA